MLLHELMAKPVRLKQSLVHYFKEIFKQCLTLEWMSVLF